MDFAHKAAKVTHNVILPFFLQNSLRKFIKEKNQNHVIRDFEALRSKIHLVNRSKFFLGLKEHNSGEEFFLFNDS